MGRSAADPDGSAALPLRSRAADLWRPIGWRESMRPLGRLIYSRFPSAKAGRPCSRCRDCPGSAKTQCHLP